MIITSVPLSRWQEAQEYERKAAQSILNKGDDWNHWWMQAFDGYKIIRAVMFPNVLEVGCGPNTNARLILPLIGCLNLYLEDPLMAEYLQMRNRKDGPAAVASVDGWIMGQTVTNAPLESLTYADASMDLLICINVLDHVQDAGKCFEQMRRVLKPGGVIVLGQDLSNTEDYKQCPDSWADVGHPIKLDEDYINSQLTGFIPLYKNILPREKGRNPRCHYGTLALIARKS